MIREKLIFKLPQPQADEDWNPLELNDLVFWGDAANGGAYINGGSPTPSDQVSDWDDRSGLNNDGTQVTSTRQPTWENNIELLYDGVNDFMNLNTVVNDINTTTTGLWSGWFKPNSLHNGILMGIVEAAGIAVDSITLGIRSDGKIRGLGQLGGIAQWRFDSDAAHFTTSDYIHIALRHTGTQPLLYVNGVNVAVTFAVSIDLTYWINDMVDKDNFGIGAFFNSTITNYYDGQHGEIILCGSSNSVTDIPLLYNYSKNIYDP